MVSLDIQPGPTDSGRPADRFLVLICGVSSEQAGHARCPPFFAAATCFADLHGKSVNTIASSIDIQEL